MMPSDVQVSTLCRLHGLRLKSSGTSTCYNIFHVFPISSNIFPKSQNVHDDHRLSPRATIHSLPNEVLLEIFDSFRRTFQCEREYESTWNSNKGWFKLAHVCQEWRQVVLTSPSRLHVRLHFTKHRSGRAIAIRGLPPLPIVVDYRSGAWLAKTQIRMISALSYPDRVCGIAFKMFYRQSKHVLKLLAAMDQHFPALESLELHCWGSQLFSQPPFLTARTPHLRSLKFIGHVTELCQVLPYTTSLVELTLGLHTIIFSTHDTQLLVHLQGLPSLRHLKVEAWDADMPDDLGRREDVLLPNLASLSFAGPIALLEAFMAGLQAPSLQELRISVYCRAIPPPTHLTAFIRNSGKEFFSVQLNASVHGINLGMSTHPHSADDPPFKIIANGMDSALVMDSLFSETLATVEDVFLASPFCLDSLPPPIPNTFHSYTIPFFTPFRGAKMLRLSPGIEPEVGEMFRNEGSSPDLLPALKEIELNAAMPSCRPIRIDEKEAVSVLESFKPFMDARQQAGHPVKVHWNTDRVLPEYFCITDI